MSNFIVNTDIPNLKVVIREGDAYNINIVPGRINTVRTGSFTSYADLAGLAVSASYVSGAGVIAQSSSYALTASYAEVAGSGGGFPYSGSAVITGSLFMLDTVNQGGITGSLYGTASVADGIDVVIAGIYETGSEGVIIPTPSGGFIYVTTASYALTASYLNNNIWENISNIPDGLLSSSVQVYYLPVESASYANTASYADLTVRNVSQNHRFTIPFISSSFISTDTASHLTFNPVTHTLQISGGIGVDGGYSEISPGGISFNSGAFHSVVINGFGVFTNVAGKAIGFIGDPTRFHGTLTGSTNPGIFVQSSSLFESGYIPLEFQGSGSYTDGRVTANRKFVAKEGIDVTGSLTISGSSTLTNIGPAIFSGSVTVVEGITGSFSGTITTASYAVTASYAMNGGGGGGSGSSGTSGTSGQSGTSGSSGTSGTSGSTGTSGSSGTAGSSGTSGSSGSTGSSGTSGTSPLVNTGSLATTGSNIFIGDQTITGSLTVATGSIVATSMTANSSSLYLTSGSNLYVQNNGIVEVTGSLAVTGSLILPTSAPASPRTGSMYFSGSFIYVYTGTQYRSASLV